MMSRFGVAPAIISSMLRRRTFSSGAPVSTWACQGWVFIEDGARLAIPMISSITARGTGCFLNPRTLLRVCTNVSNSIPLPPSRLVPFARPVLRTQRQLPALYRESPPWELDRTRIPISNPPAVLKDRVLAYRERAHDEADFSGCHLRHVCDRQRLCAGNLRKRARRQGGPRARR